MKDEYIIINCTVLEKRIEELGKDPINLQWEHNIKTHNGHSPQERERKRIVDLELNIFKEILSQSTPLIPVIEKAWDDGYTEGILTDDEIKSAKKDYISNLKLNI